MPVETRQREKQKSERSPPPAANSHSLTRDSGPESGKMSSGRWWHFNLPAEDRASVLLLTFLYVLQGIPLGLTGSIPYILTSRHVSYSEQATFSFAFWPFSLKLLWAPIVDSVYSSRIGRRKSWLLPVQYALGISMLWLSWHVTDWLGDSEETLTKSQAQNSTGTSEATHSVALFPLTAAFFWLNFLAATQDIVVDGWALSMLSRANIGWASTCNTVGQTLGYCIAFMLFLAFESKDFCNTWFRTQPQPYGLVTFSGFLLFWAIVFLVSNTFVFFFKSEGMCSGSANNPKVEKHSSTENLIEVKYSEDVFHGQKADEGEESVEDLSEKLSLMDSYRMLWKIMWLQPVLQFILTLVLVKIGVSAADSLTVLKLIERGVAKERLAILGLFSMPIQIVLPLLLNRYVTGPRPFSVYMKAALPRTLLSLPCIALVFYTPYLQLPDKSFPTGYYVFLVLFSIFQQVFVYTMFVCQMAFQARVSDPAIGGTYMTLMNTASNLAGNIPSTLVMYLVDPLSKKECVSGTQQGQSCLSQEAYATCMKHGGECVTHVEGFYILTTVCTVIGCVAILSLTPIVRRMENLSLNAWYVVPRRTQPQHHRDT